MEKFEYICNFDGATEPINPGGNMGIGAIIRDADGTVIDTLSHYVKANPNNTNNLAEYQAFGWSVKRLLDLMPSGAKILIQGDSQLVVKQMNGEWKMKSGAYVETAKRAYQILRDLKVKCHIEIEWIPREKNEVADELSKRCMIENHCEFRIQPNK